MNHTHLGRSNKAMGESRTVFQRNANFLMPSSPVNQYLCLDLEPSAEDLVNLKDSHDLLVGKKAPYEINLDLNF